MGVVFDKARNKYRASYYLHGERHEVGRYPTERGAKIALTRHRKKQDFGEIWTEKNNTGNLLDDFVIHYEDMDKGKVQFRSTPTGPNYFAKIRTWLKEQKDK